jgi:hypothetical protein
MAKRFYLLIQFLARAEENPDVAAATTCSIIVA